MQFFEFFVGGFGLLRVVSNIDKVDVYGAELNLSAKVMDGWTVFGSGNITGSEIKKNSSRPDTVGNKSPYTADYTINIGTQFVQPITDNLKGVLRADYRVTGPTWFHSVQQQVKPTIFSALLPISALALPRLCRQCRLQRDAAQGLWRGQPARRHRRQQLDADGLCQQPARQEVSQRSHPGDRIRRIVHLARASAG